MDQMHEQAAFCGHLVVVKHHPMPQLYRLGSLQMVFIEEGSEGGRGWFVSHSLVLVGQSYAIQLLQSGGLPIEGVNFEVVIAPVELLAVLILYHNQLFRPALYQGLDGVVKPDDGGHLTVVR